VVRIPPLVFVHRPEPFSACPRVDEVVHHGLPEAVDGQTEFPFARFLIMIVETGQRFGLDPPDLLPVRGSVGPGAREELAALGISLHALATWRDVLAVAREHKYFPDDALNEVESFIADPVAWSAVHGGLAKAKG
jgi:hypothetical protein